MIKLFEEYSQYYTEIDEDEMNSLEKSGDVDFTKDEVTKIKSNLTPKLKTWIVDGNYIEINFFPKSDDHAGINWIIINKIKDEWFYVTLNLYYFYKNGAVNYNSDEYYKCDQFDGLLQFIEDKKKDLPI
jgi:glucan-binding YG repeat protein